MADEDRSLRAVHADAEQRRTALENTYNSNTPSFQESLLATIDLYEQCLLIASRISLFSPNEVLEDISTVDLQYLLLDYRLADLILRVNGGERKAQLHKAQRSYEGFLRRLEDYDILSKPDAALLEQYQDAPTTFSTASSADPATKRETKIRRFKEEKAMKQKLEHMRSTPSVLQNDDAMYRDLQLTEINYCTHQSFQSLESIALELHILSLAPPTPPPDSQVQKPSDVRERTRPGDGYSERLDGALSGGLRGPILSKDGKPLRPFTLTSKRQEVAKGVFRPDHSLPTMSIDEYLEEEKRRGGMIEGGGEQSGIKPVVDEDDYELADRETIKAREWDEYTEANPKGSGNTINRG